MYLREHHSGIARARRGGASMQWTPAGQRLAIFFVVAFCLWMYEWSIQRYIVVLELLLGPALSCASIGVVSAAGAGDLRSLALLLCSLLQAWQR